MPTVKFKKNKSNAIDLNPMVDIAFQLIIFFMLTTQFKSDEPVEVVIPAATSEIKIPEKDIITITVSEDSRIFFHVDGKFTRENLLNRMANRFGIVVTEKDAESFAIASSFGLPIQALQIWIQAKPTERKLIKHTGIPCDSSRNELAEWVVNARMANPKVRIAIKADKKTPYPAIKRVIETLVDNNITRFNFITDTEIKS
ncbi:MAG: ExbD/TolR family protein [Bacteroidia bacterium]